MTPEELDQVKLSIGRMHKLVRDLWADKQLLRNLIIDRKWMSEQELEAGLVEGKKHPLNLRHVNEHFAECEQALAELGLDDWLEWFDRTYPRTE